MPKQVLVIGEDGQCQCTCATRCPLGRAGMATRCAKKELEDAGILTIDEKALDVELSILLVTIDNRILSVMVEELFAWRASGDLGEGILKDIANQMAFKIKPPWIHGEPAIRYFEVLILNEASCRFIRASSAIEKFQKVLTELKKSCDSLWVTT